MTDFPVVDLKDRHLEPHAAPPPLGVLLSITAYRWNPDHRVGLSGVTTYSFLPPLGSDLSHMFSVGGLEIPPLPSSFSKMDSNLAELVWQ